MCDSPLTCLGKALTEFSQRRARTEREFRVEQAQLKMQLAVAQVATTAAVASEASMWTTLEAAKQSTEDRATTTLSTAATATGERDALVARLALAKAEVEKLLAAATSPSKPPRGPRPPLPLPRLLLRMPFRPQPARRRRLRQRWQTWSASWAPPH
jgi:hypothetical protein